MNPTSLTTLMEDVSFLLGRISLLVPPLLLPLGGQRDALSAPVGSLYVSRHAKTPHEGRICFSPEESNAGLWISCVCCSLQRGKRGSCHPGVTQRGQQWLLPGWNSWKDAACPASAIPGGHKAPAAHTGWHSSAPSEGWAYPGITTGHGHTATVPALGRGCRVPWRDAGGAAMSRLLWGHPECSQPCAQTGPSGLPTLCPRCRCRYRDPPGPSGCRLPARPPGGATFPGQRGPGPGPGPV